MTLSIRGRLTVWSSIVTVCVLTAAAAVLSELHEYQLMHRLDESLAGDVQTAAAVMRDELDEGLPLGEAATDGLAELQIAGTGLAFLDGAGRPLGVSQAGVDMMPPETLSTAVASPRTVEHAGARARLLGARADYRGHAYRVVAWKSLRSLEADRSAVRRAMALGIPLAFLLAAGGGWLLGWRALRPLSEMARQADRMSHRRLDERFRHGHRRDELGVLGRAFNDLLDRLAGALQEQRAFMTDASHQLRTPVSIARTAAEVTLSRDDRSADEYRDALTVIATQTRRLTRIVDNMFALAIADADARPLRLQPVYIGELVDDCVKAAQVLGAARRVTVRARFDDDCQVTADEELLRDMVGNLLENAVRHAPEDGNVRVEVGCTEQWLHLAVQDDGPGIREADRERIFERFVRLDSVIGDGGGLGLPIARWIAELHGGTLTLGASGPSGTRFEAVLPIAGA